MHSENINRSARHSLASWNQENFVLYFVQLQFFKTVYFNKQSNYKMKQLLRLELKFLSKFPNTAVPLPLFILFHTIIKNSIFLVCVTQHDENVSSWKRKNMSAGCILLYAYVVSELSLNNFKTDQKKKKKCFGWGAGCGRIYWNGMRDRGMNPLSAVSHTPGHKIKGSAAWTEWPLHLQCSRIQVWMCTQTWTDSQRSFPFWNH